MVLSCMCIYAIVNGAELKPNKKTCDKHGPDALKDQSPEDE